MKNINLNQLRLVIREAMGGGEECPEGTRRAPDGKCYPGSPTDMGRPMGQTPMEEQEEEEAAPDAGALDSAGGGKEKSDVAKVLAYIQKIDNRGELAQVLMGVVQHAGNVSGSKGVLLKLYKQLPGMIKQMQESKVPADPKILREALIKESLKRRLKNAIKK